MRKTHGFTLIELLIVLAIIVILASIGIPAYSDYLVRARVTELLSVAESYKLKLIDNLFNSDATNHAVYNLNTNLIDCVTVATTATNPPKHIIEVLAKMKDQQHGGIGIVRPGAANRGLAIQLQGIDNGDIITWTCHAAEPYHKYVPKSCQNNNMEHLN